MVSVIDSDLRKNPLSAPLHTSAAAIDEYIVKRGDFDSPISLARDLVPGIPLTSLQGVDVIHLHGINGAFKLDLLQKHFPSTRVVWTLHDMNPFTGTCHYSLGCDGFISSCSQCPAVRGMFRSSVEQNLRKKIGAVHRIPQLSVVAPSTWLAEQARTSSVFRDHSIEVINNPIDPVFLLRPNGDLAPASDTPIRIVTVAKNLSDPVKNVDLAVQAFVRARPNLADAMLTLVGHGGKEFNGPGVRLAGSLSSTELATELLQSDAIIVPSRAENSPLVIGEAAASGCIPLVADNGGMRAMTENLGFGEVFANREELTHQLESLASQSPSTRSSVRRRLSERARALYSPSTVAREYGKVYGTV